MKTAKITEIKSVKGREGNYGMVYYHKIVLDNGDEGDLAKKTENAVKVGDQIDYDIVERERTNQETGEVVKFHTIKEVKQNNRGGAGKQTRNYEADFISFAMSYTKDLVIAGKVDIGKLEISFSSILGMMQKKYKELA